MTPSAAQVTIRLLASADIVPIAAAFAAIGWNKPAAQYERYLAEQEAGQRTVLVAFLDGAFVGYLTICWQSEYPPFAEAGIPEYWVLDCNDRRLLVHRDPVFGAYISIVAYSESESVAPFARPEAQFCVAEAFPR